MNLRYINLWIDERSGYNDAWRLGFTRNTRFINHFLSINIRKQKYKTDGTYNMISIAPMPNKLEASEIVPIDVLQVDIPFDKDKYEEIRGSEDCSYYLELLEQGFKKAAEFKLVPLEALLKLVEEFKNNGCKNEWLHKRKTFKKDDLEVILMCEFTTNYFQLVATINQLSTKKALVKGIVLKTEPDEILFDGMFKDIIVTHDIIITDRSDSPRIIINKNDVFKKKLNFRITGDKGIRKILSPLS